MVFAVDPQSLVSMFTGRYDESRSPEALNARPFLRGRPKPVPATRRGDAPAVERTPVELRDDSPDDPGPEREMGPRVVAVDAGDGDDRAAATTAPPAREVETGDGEPSGADEPRESGNEEGR
jgi:hypothetical protein